MQVRTLVTVLRTLVTLNGVAHRTLVTHPNRDLIAF